MFLQQIRNFFTGRDLWEKIVSSLIVAAVAGLVAFFSKFIFSKKTDPIPAGDKTAPQLVAGKPARRPNPANISDIDSAKINVNIITYEAHLRQSQTPEVNALFEQGLLHCGNKDFEKAIAAFKSCLALEKDPQKLGALNLNIGNCYYNLHLYQYAMESYQAGSNESQKANDMQGQASNMVGIANTILTRPAVNRRVKMANIRKAIRCYDNALETFTKDKYPQNYCLTAANMGQALIAIDDKTATYWLKEAYSLKQFLPDQGKGIEEQLKELGN